MFVLGIIFSLLTNFFGYLLYYDILTAAQNSKNSSFQRVYIRLAIGCAVFSIFFFFFGAFKAIASIY